MRARFYDPASGSFLQRDPEPYKDSPNSYAPLAHNPTSLRDPSGRALTPPRGPKPPNAPAPPTVVKGSPRAPAIGAPKGNPRTPKASSQPDAVAPATAKTADAGGGAPPPGGPPRPPANAPDPRLRTPREAQEIEAQFRAAGEDIEFIGQGGNWYIFQRRNDPRFALRIRKGEGVVDSAKTTEETLNGHLLWDAIGEMKLYGHYKPGDYTFSNGGKVNREIIEMENFRGFRDREKLVDSAGFNGSVREQANVTPQQITAAEQRMALHRRIFGEHADSMLQDPHAQWGIDESGRVRFPDPPQVSRDQYNTIVARYYRETGSLGP